MAAELVPVHPEAVADDARALRWVTPAGALPFVGRPTRCPAELQRLLDEGVLEHLDVEPTAVRTRLGAGLAWRTEGDRVRAAVQAALAEPQCWTAPAGSGPDDALRMAVDEVVQGEVGEYARSHGGSIEVVSATGDRVEVRLTGACAHCPAKDLTLSQRVETAIRARYPAVREVVARPEPSATGGRRLLTLTPLRRR